MKKILCALLSLFFLLSCGCGSSQNNASPAPQKPLTVQEKLDARVRDYVEKLEFTSLYKNDEYTLIAKSSEYTRTRQGLGVLNRKIMEAIFSSVNAPKVASVGFTAPVLDKYGKKSDEVVYYAVLSRDTAKKINWKNITAPMLENLLDKPLVANRSLPRS